MQRTVRIEPPVRDPTRYSLVVIGTPIWMDNVASPVRSYLEADEEGDGLVEHWERTRDVLDALRQRRVRGKAVLTRG